MNIYTTKCPHCGHTQRTYASGKINCKFCGKRFNPKTHLVSNLEDKKEVSFIDASNYR